MSGSEISVDVRIAEQYSVYVVVVLGASIKTPHIGTDKLMLSVGCGTWTTVSADVGTTAGKFLVEKAYSSAASGKEIFPIAGVVFSDPTACTVNYRMSSTSPANTPLTFPKLVVNGNNIEVDVSADDEYTFYVVVVFASGEKKVLPDQVKITVGCGSWTPVLAVNYGTTAGTFRKSPDVMQSEAATVVKGVYPIEGLPATPCPKTYAISTTQPAVTALGHSRLTVAGSTIEADRTKDDEYLIYVVVRLGVNPIEERVIPEKVTIRVGCGHWTTVNTALGTTPTTFQQSPEFFPSSLAGLEATYPIAGVTKDPDMCPMSYKISSSSPSYTALGHTRLAVVSNEIKINANLDRRYEIYIVAVLGLPGS